MSDKTIAEKVVQIATSANKSTAKKALKEAIKQLNKIEDEDIRFEASQNLEMLEMLIQNNE